MAVSQPVRSERHLAGVLQPVRPEGHSEAVPQDRKGILAEAMVHRGGRLSRGSVPEEPIFLSSIFFIEQRPDPSSFRQSFLATAPTKLPPSSARHLSHLGRASPNFPSSQYVPSSDPQPASWADLVRADPLKAHDGYSLEIPSRIGGRSPIKGSTPAGKVGGQNATPEPVLAMHDFAGGEPEPSAEDFLDGLAEQGTAGGLEYQVKIDQFQAFISGFSMAERFRVLGLPEVHAVRPPVKTPSVRSALELSQENPGSCALSRGNFRPAAGGPPFGTASRKFRIWVLWNSMRVL